MPQPPRAAASASRARRLSAVKSLLSYARWNATLEKRGVDAVRVLLSRSHGANADAILEGVGGGKIDDQPTRIYSERWVGWKAWQALDHTKERQARRDIWTKIGVAGAIIAAIVAANTWIFPIK